MYDDNRKMVDLIIDKSGSMGRKVKRSSKGGSALSKLDIVKEIFLDELEKRLDPKDQVGIVAFENSVNEVYSLNKFTEKNRRSMRKNVRCLPAGGGTALYDALGKSVDRLVNNANGSSGKDPKLTVLCMTDGKENSSKRFTTEDEVVDYANSKNVDLEVIIIGIGDHVDARALGKIANGTGGEYIPASSTQQGLGEAAQKAGGIVGGGVESEGYSKPSKRSPESRGKRRRKSWPADRSKSGKKNSPSQKSAGNIRMRFNGNLSRRKMDYMENVVKRAVELISEDWDIGTGSVTVPVYLLEEDIFKTIFGEKTALSRYCQRLYSHLRLEYPAVSDLKGERAGENDLASGRTVGAGTGRNGSANKCTGRLVGIFVNDLVFHRFKSGLKHKGLKEVSPGIYLRDIMNEGRKGAVNLRGTLSYFAVSSMIYYNTSRRSAVKRNKLSAQHPLICGTVSLLSNGEKELDELVDHSTLVGTSSLPLHLIRDVKKSERRSVLRDLYEGLPVRGLLEGEITEENEERYVEEVEDLLEELVNRYM